MGAGSVALQRPSRESRDTLAFAKSPVRRAGYACALRCARQASVVRALRRGLYVVRDARQSVSATVMILDVVAACPREFLTVIVTV